MRTFDYSSLRTRQWDSEILGLVAQIHEHKGRQELYLRQKPAVLEKLSDIAKVQSTEVSDSMEGIRTTETRLRQLMSERTTPRHRDEKEIAGYRDALNIVHENFDYIPLTPNYILQLHKILYSHMNNPAAGRTKSIQNYISATYPDGSTRTLFTPLDPFETPTALESICNEFNRVIGNNELEPRIAIPIFIHDFLCIHPFNDGNGRMSRLLTLLLLYRAGYNVGKYISIEKLIERYDVFGVVGNGACLDIQKEAGVEDADLAIALKNDTKARFLVITENKGCIPNLPADAMVEVPAYIGKNGPEVLTQNPVPLFQQGLIMQQLNSEKLIVQAAIEGSYQKALEAFTLNKTIPSMNVAKAVLDDLIEANKGYWPELK